MIPAAKLDRLLARFDAIEAEMASGAAGDAFVKLSREHAELAPVIETARAYRQAQVRTADADSLIADPATENEIKSMAEEERAELKVTLEKLDHDLRIALLPRDAADDLSAIVEIRAGTGGDEAALFAADLLEMYQRYCGLQGWRTEVMDRTESDLGGIKDATLEVNGRGAFAKLKFESGVHRVQRVPATEIRAASIPPPPPWRCCPRPRMSISRSTTRICASTFIALKAPAASMSTRPKARSASPIFPPALPWRSRPKSPSTRTRPTP